jgi:cytochrome c oxidase subunit 2
VRFLSNRIVVLVVGGIVVGVILSVALLQLPWLPGNGSEQATRTDQVIWAITYVSGALFCLVMAVMFYAIWRFRARDDLDMRDGSPVHGHTGLEIFWTAIPAGIVTVFGIWAGVILHDNEAKASPAQEEILEAHGQQYNWSFNYPRYGLKGILGDAHVPLGVHTTVKVTSSDVIHDFFVSEWRLKIDAVPGQWSTFVVVPTKPGTFLVQCAELCGPGHGPMGLPTNQSGSTASNVIVESPAKFKAWIDQQKKAQQSQSATPGLATFKTNCGGCHKFTKAGTTGASTFPDLDNLAADAKKAGQPLADYIRESIVDPNKYITPGFPQGIMPQDFGTKLSKSDIDNLVKLLSGGTS